MFTELWMDVVAGLVLAIMFGVWKRSRTVLVWFWRQVARGFRWVCQFLSGIASTIGSILFHRRYKALAADLESLKDDVESLREQVNRQEVFSNENRWLELETRRDAYVRVCRKLAPDIVVANHEPKLLVRLKDVDLANVTYMEDDEYFYLVPFERDAHDNKWAADANLSRYILESHDRETVLQLAVVQPNGGEWSLRVRWHQLSSEFFADKTQRAILTLPAAPFGVAPVDLMNSIIASLTVNSAGALIAKKGDLIPTDSRVRKLNGGEDD